MGSKTAKEAREILAKKLAKEIDDFKAKLPKGEPKSLNANEAKEMFFKKLGQELNKGVSVFSKLEKMEGGIKKTAFGLSPETPSQGEVRHEAGLSQNKDSANDGGLTDKPSSSIRSVFSVLGKSCSSEIKKSERSEETSSESHPPEETSSPGKHEGLNKEDGSNPAPQLVGVFKNLDNILKSKSTGSQPDFAEKPEDLGPRGPDSTLPLDKKPAVVEGDKSGEPIETIKMAKDEAPNNRAWGPSDGPVPQKKTNVPVVTSKGLPFDHPALQPKGPDEAPNKTVLLGGGSFGTFTRDHAAGILSGFVNKDNSYKIDSKLESLKVQGEGQDKPSQPLLTPEAMAAPHVPSPTVRLGSDEDMANSQTLMAGSSDKSLREAASKNNPAGQQPIEGAAQSIPTAVANGNKKMGILKMEPALDNFKPKTGKLEKPE